MTKVVVVGNGIIGSMVTRILITAGVDVTLLGTKEAFDGVSKPPNYPLFLNLPPTPSRGRVYYDMVKSMVRYDDGLFEGTSRDKRLISVESADVVLDPYRRASAKSAVPVKNGRQGGEGYVSVTLADGSILEADYVIACTGTRTDPKALHNVGTEYRPEITTRHFACLLYPERVASRYIRVTDGCHMVSGTLRNGTGFAFVTLPYRNEEEALSAGQILDNQYRKHWIGKDTAADRVLALDFVKLGIRGTKNNLLLQTSERVFMAPGGLENWLIYSAMVAEKFLREVLGRRGDVPTDLIERHDWRVVVPGDYDTVYQCSKCDARYTLQMDNPESVLPEYGCQHWREL